MNDRYVSIRRYAHDEVDALLTSEDLTELQYVPIGIGMFDDDLNWAQQMCLQLTSHQAPLIRGNALLGLAHIARRFGTLDLTVVMPVIEALKHDSEEYVRLQANDAFDDIQHYVMRDA